MAKGQITGKGLVHDSAFQVFERLDKQVQDSIRQVNNLQVAMRSALSGTALSNQSNQGADTVRKTTKALTEQEKVLRQITIARERNTRVTKDSRRELIAQREQLNQTNRELREEARLSQAAQGSYRKLRLERDKAANTLRDLITSQKASNREIQQAQREFNKLDGRVKKADHAVKNFRDNVGNYRSALQPAIGILRQLVGVFGVVQTIRIAWDFGKEASELAKQARGVEFAFERLGETGVKAFKDVKEVSNGAISDMGIKRSLVELNNFNIDLEQAGVLFEFLTVRSLQTGQSIDKLKQSLVEGLSKESLLRIDNLGISTADLNKQLDKTPNFVEAVATIAQKEIAKAGDIIKEASNSTEIFASSWENLKVSMGQAVNRFSALGPVANIVNRLTEGQQAYNVAMDNGEGFFSRMRVAMNLFTAQGRENNRVIVEETEARKKATEELEKQMIAERNLYELRDEFIGPRSKGNETDSVFNFLATPGKTIAARLEEINKELEDYQDKLGKTVMADKEAVSFIRTKIKALEDEKNALEGKTKATAEALNILENTVGSYQEQIKELTQLRDSTAQTAEEYENFNDQIWEVEKRIRLLTQGIQELKKAQALPVQGITETFDPNESVQAIDPIDVAQGINDQIIKNEEKKAAALKAIREGELGDFKNFTDEETKILQNALDQQAELRRQSQQAVQDLVFGGIQAIFDARVQAIDDQLQLERDALDRVLNSQGASDKQKLAAQRKFDAEEKRLLEERRKRERAAFLVQQGLAVAQIAIDLARTISAINLTAAALDTVSLGTAGQAYRAANIPIAIATAGLQTGLILAQTLPQFYKGKNAMDDYEGPATWGERRREVRIDRHGNIEVSPNRTTPLLVKRDDIITPSIDSFQRQMSNPSTEVYRRVSRSLQNDTDRRSAGSTTKSKTDTKEIATAIDRAMRKYANRPVNVNASIVDDRKVKSYL